MRVSLVILACVALGGIMFKGCQSSKSVSSNDLANQADSIQSVNDSISYVLGKNMYQNFKKRDVQINEKLMAKGLLDAANSNDTLIHEKHVGRLMMKFQQKMREKMRQRKQQQGPQNRKQQMKEKLKEKLKKQKQQQQQQQQQPEPDGN